MSTLEGLTRIIVISLDDAHERREEFRRKASQFPFEWTFFDAHRSLSPDLSYDEAKARRTMGRPLQPGELGCYSSHYAIWKNLLSDNVGQYLVLEDDVTLDWRRLEQLASHDLGRSGIEYLRLYYKKPCEHIVLQRPFLWRGTALLQLLGKAYGTQAYMITRRAAEWFVSRFSCVTRPIDDCMDRFWAHGVPNLAIFPFPLFEEAVPSLIGASRFAPDSHNQAIPASTLWRERLTRRSAIFATRVSHAIRRRTGGSTLPTGPWPAEPGRPQHPGTAAKPGD